MAESELIDRVNRDPELNASEKETTITMRGDEKEYSVFSAKPTVVKSLLKHDHFELDRARLMDDSEWHRVDERSKLEASDGDIVAVEGTMPIGTLTVKSKPRANNNQSSIVNAETIDPSVFEDG